MDRCVEHGCVDTLYVCIRNATFLCDYHRYHFLDSLLIFYGILFVCLFFLFLSHSASHSGLLSASFLPIFIVFSTDYSDYCVRCSFQFGSFAALRFSSALNMLFKNFLNRITINLSTSAPRQNSHEVHSGKQAHNTTHEHTMDIDFHFGTREEEKKNTPPNEFHTIECGNGI